MREKNLLFEQLIYARTIDGFPEIVDIIYAQLEKYGLFLRMDKICLYNRTAKWCGRVLTKDGVAYDSSNIKLSLTCPCSPPLEHYSNPVCCGLDT